MTGVRVVTPPRTAEAVLEALSAEARFGDALLGDLAEEFALRAERDGVGLARRWYYRETIRTAPHLLRDWWRGARLRDVRYLLGVAVTSYVFVVILMTVLARAARGVVMATNGSADLPLPVWNSPIWLAVDLVIGAAATTLAGYIAAWLGRRAPLVSALALGVLWSGVWITIATVTGVGPPWGRLVVFVVTVLGTTAGGVLRVRGEPRALNATGHGT